MGKARKNMTILMLIALIGALILKILPKNITKSETKSLILNWSSVILMLVAVGILLVKVVTNSFWFMLM